MMMVIGLILFNGEGKQTISFTCFIYIFVNHVDMIDSFSNMLGTLKLCSNVSIQVSSRYKELEEIGSSYITIHSLYPKPNWSMGCSQVPYRQRD